MNQPIRLCRADEVEDGSPVAVTVQGAAPLAVYKAGGAYFATANLCTHGDAELTDGFQDGFTIECPFHGGAFDIRTGEPTAYPCNEALKVYPVQIREGWVTIEGPIASQQTSG